MNTTSAPCYIECRELKFSYSNGLQIEFPDLCFQRGEHWLITGSSGSGKTTLLHLMAGLLKPQTGKIRIGDHITSEMSNTALDKFRGKEIGIVFQTSHFVQSLSIGENLELARFLAKNSPDKPRVNNLLERLGLGDKTSKKPHQLSIGEQQRAAIARAMVNQPAVVLADEPTASLDDRNTKIMIELLQKECAENGATLIIVTHDQRIKNLIENVVEL